MSDDLGNSAIIQCGSETLVSCPAEPVGGEDHPDSGPESAGHLPLVRGGQARAGESHGRPCICGGRFIILAVNDSASLPGGGEPAGERHRGDREQEPAAAHADHAVPEPADAEHQPPHHVSQRCHRRGRQRRAGSLPGGTDGWVEG